MTRLHVRVRGAARSTALAPALAAMLALAPAASSPGQDRAGQTAAQTSLPFDGLMPRVAATAPGTYVFDGAALTPAPEGTRIPVMVQADVIGGADASPRVGIVVGAVAPQAVNVRVRLSTVPAGQEAARVVGEAGGSGTSGPLRLVREFSLAPGDYDIEAVVGHSASGGGVIAAIGKSRLTVPDVRGGSLAVTPIVAGDASNGPRRADVPFIFGQTRIDPAVSPRFSQASSISVAFRIYNWTAKTEEKPDLTVEYLFYEQGAKGLHFFNKVKPQQLTAASLGTAFDPAAGSVAAGMLVPLNAFTFGDFQLMVRVTDNRSHTSAERRLSFSVVP